MTRTRAEELILVNWKGQFFQRYLLDPQVTALEGKNGAGKTTVMIAAYVVLLPDMSRLRFTNLGETAPTGGDRGVFGRLGDPGPPSFTAVAFRLPDRRRLIAGVCLERRTEPVVEPSTFVITDLPEDVGLENVLLDRKERDEVPTLERVRELVTLHGARLKTFTSLREYFGELFDQGITPLRLATDEERTKLNEMLRTSMVGGISRALTGGLRDFLLKEETGLADNLRRMRGNLDACRQTRLDVEVAARLEGEIHRIFEAGQRMFAAALFATRNAQGELRAQVDQARDRRDQAAQAVARAQEALENARRESSAADAQRDATRTDLASTTTLREQVRRANEIEHRLVAHARQRSARVVERDDRVQAHARAIEARLVARRAHESARADQAAAARALADSRAQFEDLERRAGAHSLVTEKLAFARNALSGEPESLDDLDDVRQGARERLNGIDTTLARSHREVATAAARRLEFNEIISALERTAPATTWGELRDGLLETARAALADFARLQTLSDELTDLPGRREEAQRLADRQSKARQQAESLSTIVFSLRSAQAVRQALTDTQADLQAATIRERELDGTVGRARGELEEAGRTVRSLEKRLSRWQELAAIAVPLAARLELPLQSRAHLDAARTALRTQAREHAARRAEAEERHTSASEEASRLAQGAGGFSDALLRARDQVGGELLAARFEDVELSAAPGLEALLGPLRDAIVVEDIPAATSVLEKSTVAPDSVWLLDTTTQITVASGQQPPGDLKGTVAIVPADGGVRVTRVPPHPSLGRRARERRITELRGELDGLAKRVTACRAAERATNENEERLAELMTGVEVLAAGDPIGELTTARVSVEDARRSLDRARSDQAGVQRAVAELSARQRALVQLAPDAPLLDLTDQRQVVVELESRISAARRARVELERTLDDRALISRQFDVLRQPPPTASELEDQRRGLTRLEADRDAAWRVVAALDYVDEHRVALDWTDAAKTLESERALAPAREERYTRANAAFDEAQARVDRADEAVSTATTRMNKAQGEVDAIDATIQQARTERTATGIEDATDDALKQIVARVEALTKKASEHEKAARTAENNVARHEERVSQTATALEKTEKELTDAEAAWRPANERWERLRAMSEARGLVASAMARSFQEELGGLASPSAWTAALQSRALLIERLESADDGRRIAVEIVGWLEKDDGRRAESYLEAWLKVRDWLLQRIPPQIAEVADPLQALQRLRDHLLSLQEKLERQERNLRGDSEDVARNIDTQLRKARTMVARLNDELTNVRFGSICGVQIRVEQEARMAPVLEALRSGPEQQVLFQAELTIEAALEQLLQRHGGGRSGGHRLLDYREYLDLRVEIRRQDRPDWETANPARLSTGEAIGVGAAVMMVVLTAWERDANFARAKKSAGTLRLLFLDEATRLSQDNLVVLFELCRTLELQLIIAAPEVAHGGGNTTYCLVRKIVDGREEVLVTGRRIGSRVNP